MANGDDTRKRILDAAGPIFAEKGFEAATVRDICEAASVNGAAINYHFGGKEQLYLESFRRAHPALATQWTDLRWEEGTPPEEKLRDYVHAKMRQIFGASQEPWKVRLTLREMLDPRPATLELFSTLIQDEIELVDGVIQELVPVQLPRYRRRQVTHSIVGQCVFFRMIQKTIKAMLPSEEVAAHYQPEPLAEHVYQVIAAALGAGLPIPQIPGVALPPDETEPQTGASVDTPGPAATITEAPPPPTPR